MIARLLISPYPEKVKENIEKNLPFPKNHVDVLYFEPGESLGIEQARKIKEHFSLKPYSAKGRVVIIEDASRLTVEAQNALLKILEEPPENAIIILGAPSDANFLPAVLSRVSIHHTPGVIQLHTEHDIEKLINSSVEERFEYIEKCKDRKELLKTLVFYFRQKLPAQKDFVKELLQAESWSSQNVNIRAILEYLMLVMPDKN